jgi:aryl-alcohol dehydrogenase
VSFDVNNLMIAGKGIRGILEGESVPDIFIPHLIELNAQGRFPFEKLTKFYSLDQINQAAQDSEKGGTIKPIIRLSPTQGDSDTRKHDDSRTSPSPGRDQ